MKTNLKDMASNITEYLQYLISHLQTDSVGKAYQKAYPSNHIIHPDRLQILQSTTGFVIVFVGNNVDGKPRFEDHVANIPYQEAMFGENVSIGKPAFNVREKYLVIDGLVIGQKQVQSIAPEEIVKTGGPKFFGDRLIDVGSDADVTLLNCFFHFLRNKKYESVCQELIMIFGTNYAFDTKAAKDKVKHLTNILSGKLP